MRLLITSPVRSLLAEYDGTALRGLHFFESDRHPPAGTRDEPARGDVLGRQIVREMREYFAGERKNFDLPLSPRGTPFQQKVWNALRAIPFGSTRSYGTLADEIGTPGAARAVGQANRRNPIPIIIPCHRVLAASGSIGGYMGSGPDGDGTVIKRWLLIHEGVELKF
ncbi:MAG TPA: methylated-DNA--[protein]-cysteine S-methyltransferase [Longimicrobiaceae bacterium]|nr:methylated-DNA--[protein]-cysteine S-methyltransferase [Longimicrobiaceae bacterium]